MTINFYPLKNFIDKSKVEIYCYVRSNYKTLILKTGIVISEKNWIKDTQKVKQQATNSVVFNGKMEKMKELIDKTYIETTTNEPKIPIDTLLNIIKDKFKTKADTKLIDLINRYIEIRENQVSKFFLKNLITLKNHIIAYNPNIEANKYEMDELFIDDFINHLTSKGLTSSTIEGLLKRLKIVLHWAFAKKLLILFDINHIKVSSKKSNYQTYSLSIDEIQKLWHYKPENETEKITLYGFLFSCFTGLRFSDIKNFDKITINNGFIELLQNKTSKPVNIILLPQAKLLLDKFDNNRPFDKLHAQLSNRRLKVIAKNVKLDRIIKLIRFVGNNRIEENLPLNELISYHDGRRTFTTLLTEMNFNPDLIKEMTGHRTQAAYEKYIKFNDEQKNKLATTFTDKFELQLN